MKTALSLTSFFRGSRGCYSALSSSFQVEGDQVPKTQKSLTDDDARTRHLPTPKVSDEAMLRQAKNKKEVERRKAGYARARLLRVRKRLFGRSGWGCACPPDLNPFAAAKCALSCDP